MKNNLGLDLGTNSIGWALVKQQDSTGEILGLGSRIIPMSQDVLDNFGKGISKSQTAERTAFRSVRRLRERHLLRRERLHRVLNIMGFLPEHYTAEIDFVNHYGKFIPEREPKIAWKEIDKNQYDFLFKDSFNEMVADFRSEKPELFLPKKNGENRSIPYDWTIYYLRNKALSEKIAKEEIAWLILNFNQKRGYYQLRGEDDEENPNKCVEFHSLRVENVIADNPVKGKPEIWYSIILENGWVYRRSSKTPLFDWLGKTKEFIVTTELDDDGNIKKDKDGNERRSFRAPSADDWTLIKKKTEEDIHRSNCTVGTYIYKSILNDPKQKIKGKLVRTIERKFYKQELEAILEKQKQYHPELRDKNLLALCSNELYAHNEEHREILNNGDFTKLFLNDIIFYQRPLRSKKSLVSNCQFEVRKYKDSKTGEERLQPIKCIAKSHPLFQEFRLWQFVANLRVYEYQKLVDGKLKTDVDVTNEFLKSEEDFVALFEWLNDKKEIKQDSLLTSYFKVKKNKGEDKLPYRWNYVEDKEYPCNETRTQILSRLAKINSVPKNFLDDKIELELWHILYSVEDKLEIAKALSTFSQRHGLGEDFVETFRKFPPFRKEYGSYSAKAIKKLLPLMRMGKYWSESEIDHINERIKNRIQHIITGEYDERIRSRVREKAINLKDITHFRGLPLWLASYIIYDRHSEAANVTKWSSPSDIDNYLFEFRQHSLRNPIVEQVVTETLRVVRDIWRKYGDFNEIHIELGREMKNPADKRARLTAQISENENTNLRIKALLAELANHGDVENVRPYSPSQLEILKIFEEGVLNSGVEVTEEIQKISKSSKPTQSELIRYKLWLEQKYRSPYTGEIIPLSKLFTPYYNIEHIIPQSRYFDDSLSNKVICESVVNAHPYKDNQLGFEFIKNNEGRVVTELSNANRTVKIFTVQEYENFVKEKYGKTRNKLKKLLMEDIPEAFIERQLNDSRYISKFITSLLSNIVREEGEEEAISKNVISCNGSITDTLKKEWGLNDVWNRIISPRFERMNELTKSDLFGHWTNKEGKKVFQIEMPLELQRGFSKKRIDHRHHAMDALVIACASRNHVNYLNNESAKPSSRVSRFDLKNILCYKTKLDEFGNYKWQFHKPWNTFTQDAQEAIESTIVSFKQNLRVINKTVNRYQKYSDGKRIIEVQTKGDSWAIRKPLHKDTVSGLVKLMLTKDVSLASAIDQKNMIVDKELKSKIKNLIAEGLNKSQLIKYFGEEKFLFLGKDISKVSIFYWEIDKDGNGQNTASREILDTTFNEKRIETITDSGVRKILLNHLYSSKFQNQKDEAGKAILPEHLAFTPEGIEEMNNNITILNNGRFHQPIYKVRTFEPKGNKFNVGTSGNKKDKYVEADKGANLFFAIYCDVQGNRSFETIPLYVVIERLKVGLKAVPELNEKGAILVDYLSPDDLVYVPTKDEISNSSVIDFGRLDREQISRIYKVEKFSGYRCYFIRNDIASLIKSYDARSKYGELESQNKLETTMNAEKIKIVDCCIKLKVSRLGTVTL